MEASMLVARTMGNVFQIKGVGKSRVQPNSRIYEILKSRAETEGIHIKAGSIEMFGCSASPTAFEIRMKEVVWERIDANAAPNAKESSALRSWNHRKRT